MAGRRSDPKKLAADREAIRRSVENFERRKRVMRSRAQAQADAEAFKQTGEGTMGEAFMHILNQAAERRARRKNPPPREEGARVIGFKKGNTTA